jgi:hypothetical protein
VTIPDQIPPPRSRASAPETDIAWPPESAEPGTTVYRLLATGLIGFSVLAILVPLFFSGIVKVREAAVRTQSINNLKQLSLGASSYHDTYKCLPFNGTKEPYDYQGVKIGGPARPAAAFTGSWMFPLLPFLDSTPVFTWEPNPTLGISVFLCPGRGRPVVCTKGAWTDYLINAWLNDNQHGSVSAPDMKRTMVDITDGTANTIFAGHGSIDRELYGSNVPGPHSCEIYRGGETGTARNLTTNHRDTRGDGTLDWGGPFSPGSLMGFLDGTVRMIPYTVSGGVMRPGMDGATAPGGGLAPFLTPTGRDLVIFPD